MASAARNIQTEPGDAGGSFPDDPIDRSIPYRTRERGAARHFGFMPFFAKKPWPVVQEYIKHYSRPGTLVGDPFVGSGVTAVEALVLGRRVVVSDINPVAAFITRTTAVSPVDLEALQRAYDHVQDEAQSPIEELTQLSPLEISGLLAHLRFPHDPIPSTVRRGGLDTLDQLHTPRQLAALAILRDAIAKIVDPIARDLLRVAFANTVRYANRTYILPFDGDKRRSAYRGDAGFLRRFSYSPASERLFYEVSVWPTFEMRYKAVRTAKEETNQLIGDRFNDKSFRLVEALASHFHEITGEGNLDYCFTDPPYSNDIYFLDLSVLWAAWLDLPITDQQRRNELIIGGTQRKDRSQFLREFSAALESIARALKQDAWLTLVYKHKDLSLWQSIVGAGEESGLQYVNAVWQDVRIPSTRQNESPNINPSGDMYLNFRRMAPARFEIVYPRLDPVALPTKTNYIEYEVERLIVSYLGAEIELVTAGVIQQTLDSRAFRNYREDPTKVAKDLQAVLAGGRFVLWHPPTGKPQWVMAPGVQVEVSLEPVDRARYQVFALLRAKHESTVGEVWQDLLTQLAGEPAAQVAVRDVAALLRTVGREVEPGRWRFDPTKVTEYKQLRLLFSPSRVDTLRERVEKQADVLRPNLEGLTLIRDVLALANRHNADFEIQSGFFLDKLQIVLSKIRSRFAGDVEQVRAIGDWAIEGFDLRDVDSTDVLVRIVLRGRERSFELYWQIAQDVFADRDQGTFLVQFDLVTADEWRRAQDTVDGRNEQELLGIPILSRSWL